MLIKIKDNPLIPGNGVLPESTVDAKHGIEITLPNGDKFTLSERDNNLLLSKDGYVVGALNITVLAANRIKIS